MKLCTDSTLLTIDASFCSIIPNRRQVGARYDMQATLSALLADCGFTQKSAFRHGNGSNLDLRPRLCRGPLSKHPANNRFFPS